MRITVKGGTIPAAKDDVPRRMLIPTILIGKWGATFVFWKWMLTIQWANF